ncbi:hypothetical protein [Bacillus sp. 1006-3]|uniref:hypothetical protein n=1 Tax=Bacillus sp. 1006-3 TaxID=2922309 RepID=UPI001F0E6B34|nr:hypothetical protein [Bacillus sp. 1006-3]MCH4866801.1 hypothetical protein [Bacillus sp. 1006-3]
MKVTILEYSREHAYVRIEKGGREWTTFWAKAFDDKGNVISPTVKQVKAAFREDPESFK